MKSVVFHFIILLALSSFFTACNTTKYIKENELLLTKNIIKIDDKKTSDYEITSYLIQRPNTSLLGIPLGLHLYNIGNPSYDTIHERKIADFVERNSFWDRVFSKKQSIKLLKKRKNINRWFLEKGEAPVILNTAKTQQTAKKLRAHFFNNGYFKSSIKTIIINDVEKANIIYQVTKNKPFYIGDISYKISSPSVKKTLEKKLPRIPLKKGDQYKLENFKTSIHKITNTLRNNGYYYFNEGLVSFREIDTLAKDHITPVKIYIENRKIKKGKEIIELPTKIQTVKNVTVFTDYSYQNRNLIYNVKKQYDSLHFFAHKKLKHRVKTLANSIFIEPNKIYNDKDVELTRRHLRSLNNFKSIKIAQKELPNDELATIITLTPQKKFGIGLNTEIIHSNIKQLGLSGGFSFINRNSFKGAEIFKLSLQGSIFDTATNLSSDERASFNAHEFGIDASLEFPRFIFPFLTQIIPRTMFPKSRITVGTSFQRNIGLDRQKLSGIIDYSWKSSRKHTHNLELLNLQFINNLNTESYYNIYRSEYNKIAELQPIINPNFNLTRQNATAFVNNIPNSFATTNPGDFTLLKNIAKRQDIITSNNIIPATSYTFEHNSRRGLSDISYKFLKVKLTSSGNLGSLLFKNDNGEKIFENIAISEFLKIDLDFRQFWSRSPNSSLAFRTFIGAAIPVGKNKDIPFITSYFAGGSNDIRAWQTYALGPGSSNSGLEFNIGNLKLLTSLEYRFKIINSFHGALFADAGNIWNLPNSNTASENELFKGVSALEKIALGTGLGIRYDFNFLVLRLDLAFKTFEPYLKENRWFSNYKLEDSVLNIGINYPF